RADVFHHATDACEQAWIVERRWADIDTVLAELACVAHEPRRMCQRSHRHGSFARRHPAERVPRDERRLGAEIRRPQGGGAAGGPGAEDDDIPTRAAPTHAFRSASQRRARSPGMKPYSPPRVTTNRGNPTSRLRTGRCGTVKPASDSFAPMTGSLSLPPPK